MANVDFSTPAGVRKGTTILAVVVALGSMISGCGNLKPGVPESTGTHIFEACQAQIKTKAVAYSEANNRSRAYFDAGNKKDGCQFRRRALDAVSVALKSFETGECQKFHEVADEYISWKVRAYQQRLANEQKTTQDAFQRDCGQI